MKAGSFGRTGLITVLTLLLTAVFSIAAFGTGTKIETPCRRYIDCRMPVPLRASIGMKPTVNGARYRLFPSGKPFMRAASKHCLLLTGCDEGCYFFNGPWDGHDTVAGPRDTVRQRHRAQGNAGRGHQAEDAAGAYYFSWPGSRRFAC